MNSYNEYRYYGFTLKIGMDWEQPVPNPRNWDNLGIIFTKRRTGINEAERAVDDFDSIEDAEKWVYQNSAICLPLYKMEHGNTWFNTSGFGMSDPTGFDWGQIGWYYTTADRIKEEFQVKRITKRLKEKVARLMEREIRQFSNYASGNILEGLIMDGDECLHQCFYYNDESVEEILEDLKREVDRFGGVQIPFEFYPKLEVVKEL
uniref:Uncharacterized protein n=1 Tax=Dictyoglomus turgidum TaxID=513050 RepID=A0A7C3WXT6_9BACT